MLILGIETSCDETSASVVRDGVNILSNEIASSLDLHKKYGGIVPEIACRYHLECINYVIKEGLDAAKTEFNEIGLIAVTYGPGLTGALLIGISIAKALSYSLSIPLIGVNHLYAHIYSAMMNDIEIKFPCVGLVVSGGHTVLVSVLGYNNVKLLGQTRDDACGEAFDKAAKVLKLGFPGGPVIEKEAEKGNPHAIDFPRAYLEKGSFDFSFSGVKTALLYYVRDADLQLTTYNLQLHDVCASFQKAIFDVIVDKAISACIQEKLKQLLVGGGVSTNKVLQAMLKDRAKAEGIEVLFPKNALCTDNAAMVAGAGYRLYKEGVCSDYSLDAEPNLGLGYCSRDQQ
ncbi:MAG: tRNA (adenosine(37)-N6)-threonylcarbamoyltransferase complex transferase subunit TsaD [Candidatus Omnitrophota bacterium]|nr:MAG: tRNA (adenosine(37)-N6)-threonylcarbamoyltransferase complex transferase subunit TsaD [Candidatus Omnitrophota bacterium]